MIDKIEEYWIKGAKELENMIPISVAKHSLKSCYVSINRDPRSVGPDVMRALAPHEAYNNHSDWAKWSINTSHGWNLMRIIENVNNDPVNPCQRWFTANLCPPQEHHVYLHVRPHLETQKVDRNISVKTNFINKECKYTSMCTRREVFLYYFVLISRMTDFQSGVMYSSVFSPDQDTHKKCDRAWNVKRLLKNGFEVSNFKSVLRLLLRVQTYVDKHGWFVDRISLGYRIATLFDTVLIGPVHMMIQLCGNYVFFLHWIFIGQSLSVPSFSFGVLYINNSKVDDLWRIFLW